MLDSYIIDEIKKREKRQEDRPQLPLPEPLPPKEKAPDKPAPTVIEIDYS